MSVWINRGLPLIVLFIFQAKLLPAQLMGIRHFKIEHGANPVKIFTLYKDQQGYIYTGTSEGLYKFDGLKFTEVPFQNPVSSKSVTSIFQDNKQLLWVGFQSGDIATVENGKLLPFRPEEGTPKKRITAFLQDKQNNIWFATDGEGIYYTYNNHLYNINATDGLAENNIYTMALTDNGDVLAGSDQGISICKISGAEKKIININSKNGLPDNFVKLIIPAGNNNFWIGMQDKGICLFNKNVDSFSLPISPGQSSSGEINDILPVNNGLWISSAEKGIFKLDHFNQTAFQINAPDDETLKTGKLLQDNEGNIWTINNSNELIKTNGDRLKLQVRYNGNEFEKVHAILCDNKNNIWHGAEQGVIKILNDGKSKEQKFTINELDDKTDITALFQDANNFIWIGTMGKGIFLLNAETGTYRHITENELLIKGSVLSITGKEKDVFVTSLEGAATFSSGGKALNGILSFNNFSNITSIGSNYIYSIFKDSKNRIWFATDGKGITVLHDNTFTNYNETSGIKDKVVYSITEDHKGNIWFSTHSTGIYKFDGKKFTNFSIANGLSDINISAIKTDDLGNIIIIYKKGIDILNPETGKLYYMNGAQGIKEINIQDLGTVAIDTSGGILVSTTDGIACYHSVKHTVHQPQTILENVQLFFNNIEKPTESNFNYNENNLTFLFTALYYSEPEAVQYQYKLDGYNIKWITTKDKSITFPQLPPGKYAFHVRSSINNFFGDANEATYQFHITRPFWSTWWFIISCLLITCGLFYWYVNIRERHVKKLEHLQQEKIQFQFETLRNQVNPHFLFNSFNTLISVIEENPKMAVEYVEQLSDFFRNIVNYRDKEIIALEEEIKLLQTYFFIQQKRYGENLQLDILLTRFQRSKIYIPPLTLQLLTENAIKHNAVSKETPLHIKIFMKDERLLICNNINVKLTVPTGAGMGLQNIINRYNLLSKKKVEIINDDKYFTVSLPALKHKL